MPHTARLALGVGAKRLLPALAACRYRHSRRFVRIGKKPYLALILVLLHPNFALILVYLHRKLALILGSMGYLRRKIDSYLQEWKADKDHNPLIVKGARQIEGYLLYSWPILYVFLLQFKYLLKIN